MTVRIENDDFDADVEHEWAKKWRVPRVTSLWPEFYYEAAVAVPVEDGTAWTECIGLREPSDEEAEIIGSFIEYSLQTYFSEYYREKMRANVFDIDSSAKRVIFALTEWGWTYRVATWEYGPVIVPSRPRPDFPDDAQYPAGPAGLITLIGDRVTFGAMKWRKWRMDHPEIFARWEEEVDVIRTRERVKRENARAFLDSLDT